MTTSGLNPEREKRIHEGLERAREAEQRAAKHAAKAESAHMEAKVLHLKTQERLKEAEELLAQWK